MCRLGREVVPLIPEPLHHHHDQNEKQQAGSADRYQSHIHTGHFDLVGCDHLCWYLNIRTLDDAWPLVQAPTRFRFIVAFTLAVLTWHWFYRYATLCIVVVFIVDVTLAVCRQQGVVAVLARLDTQIVFCLIMYKTLITSAVVGC